VANRLQRVMDRVLPEVTAKRFWLMVVLAQFNAPPTLMLDHKSAAMTLDTYADLFDDDLDAVAGALDQARTLAVVGK